MKRVVATVAVAAALVLAGTGCGGSTPPSGGESTSRSGHGILFVKTRGDNHSPWNSFTPVYLWRPARPASPPVLVGPADASVDGKLGWSPDGMSIVFYGQISADGWDQANPDHFFEMKANGTGVKEMHSGFGAKNLVYSAFRYASPGNAYYTYGGRTITLVNPATHRSTVFASTSRAVQGLWSSRTGKLAVLEAKYGTGANEWLVVYSSRGRELERLRVKALVGGVCNIAWSPDGERLLVVGPRPSGFPFGDNYRIWMVGLSSRRWRKLPPRPANNCAVSWR